MGAQDIVSELKAHFPGIDAKIELEPTTDKYNGCAVWDGFEGLTFLERQKMIFNVLRAAFGVEAQLIALIFTYTPSENEELDAA